MNGCSASDLSERFVNCISLGAGCETASAMQAYGLRSFSGPFDWCSSQITSVFLTIENDFTSFLNKENLILSEKYQHYFFDKKYGFAFPHEIEKNEDFEKDYKNIKQKYTIRINRFLNAIKFPTMFIRTVDSAFEIDWINNNREYIESIIKKENKKNDIVFIITNGINEPKWGTYFQLQKSELSLKWNGDQYNLFCYPAELHKFMMQLLPSNIRKENLKFFLRESFPRSLRGDPSLEVNQVVYGFFAERSWYIWGAGVYGFRIKKLLEKYDVKIHGYIDSASEKWGGDIEGIKIFSWEESSRIADNIFIAVADKEICLKIKNYIKNHDKMVFIYDFVDLQNYIVAQL